MTNGLNIIVLDPQENVICWLDPSYAVITESNKEVTQRSITITYPLDKTSIEWYKQGNKIWIPEIMGLTPCLYVLNTKYTLDYWTNNNISVTAEEVLTELNYLMYADITVDTNGNFLPVTVDKTFINTHFGIDNGGLYEIGTIQTPTSTENQTITPTGTMSKLSLLRLIETSTGNIFITEYTEKNNVITRTLNWYRPENLGNIYNIPLDLNYNMESLDFSIDESSTYSAMAPLLGSATASTTETGTTIVDNTSTTATATNTDTTNTTPNTAQVIVNWKNLAVTKGSQIPLIITHTTEQVDTTDNDGNTTTTEKTVETITETWTAPYTKLAGNYYITDELQNNRNYNYIPVKNNKGAFNLPPKQGQISTSETDARIIYNICALELNTKKYPDAEISISMSDINSILNQSPMTLSLYDKVNVKVPGLTSYIPCTITETSKNMNSPTDDKLTFTTTVNSSVLRQQTEIKAYGTTYNTKDTNIEISGELLTENGNPLSNQTINIVLYENPNSTTSQGDTTVVPKTFDPDKYTYIFTQAQILSHIKGRTEVLETDGDDWTTYTFKSVAGGTYEISNIWARAIRNAYYYYYIYAEDNSFPTSIAVNTTWTNKAFNIVYWYYKKITETGKVRSTYIDTGTLTSIDCVGYLAHNWQGDAKYMDQTSCMPTCISMALEGTSYFKTEEEIIKLFDPKWKLGTPMPEDTDTSPENAQKILKKLGLKNVVFKRFTEDNITDMNLGESKMALITVDCSKLPWWIEKYKEMGASLPSSKDAAHELLCDGWMRHNGVVYLQIHDPAWQGYDAQNEFTQNQVDVHADRFVKFDVIRNALPGSSYYDGYNFLMVTL